MIAGLKSMVILTTSVYYCNGGSTSQSTDRGRGEIGGGYLSSQLVRVPQLCSRVKGGGRAPGGYKEMSSILADQ
jgi:hypothetical protein